MTNVERPTRREVLGGVVGSIAQEMVRVLPAGDIAELRRMRADGSASIAFWKLMARRVEGPMGLPDHGARRERLERRWMLILSCMAELTGLHEPKRPLGRALVEAGLSEARLARLLRARGESLEETLRAVCHQLASSGKPANQTDLALLVLSEDEADEPYTRRRIARDYFRAQRSDS